MAERTPADGLRRRITRLVGAKAPAAAPAGSGTRKRKTPGKMLRAKPPNVRGRGPLLDGPPLGLAIVAIVKDEADYLEEWLAFHLALGVDHFFIYDNGSTDGSAELLERYINHGLITRIDWPIGGGQLAAYNHALRMFGGSAEWLAYFDPDEFLVPLADDDIPAFLARYPDAADLRIPRVEFGFSGHRHKPEGLTIANYTQVADVLTLDPKLPPRVKSIVRPHAVTAIDIHLAFPADMPAPGQPTKTYEAELRGVVQLSHYYTRSYEEFEAKRFRGSATGRIDRAAVDFDLPSTEVNDHAARYAPRTRAMIERMHSLDPQPYMYGSHIGFEFFPRPNDLFRFGEFAIANTVAGWEQPGRVAAMRLKNLYDGVGVVADVGHTDYQPSRAGLSASVHTEALVAHMRGRVEASLVGSEPAVASVLEGTLDVPHEGPAVVGLPGGAADVFIDLPQDDARRCYYLAFVIGAEGPLTLEAAVDHVGRGSSDPIRFDVPASRCIAGVVEVEPTPVQAQRMRVTFEGGSDGVRVEDLFVISTG